MRLIPRYSRFSRFFKVERKCQRKHNFPVSAGRKLSIIAFGFDSRNSSNFYFQIIFAFSRETTRVTSVWLIGLWRCLEIYGWFKNLPCTTSALSSLLPHARSLKSSNSTLSAINQLEPKTSFRLLRNQFHSVRARKQS